MRLFERVSRLVKSDAHGILEQLEEQSLLLKQHLREAEIEVERKRARAEALEEEQRRAREQLERLETREASLDEDVELALAGGKEDLARFAVGQLLPIREARRELRSRIAEIASSRDRLGERLAAQERALEDLETRVHARLSQLEQERCEAPAPGRRVADEEIELELLRRSAVRGGGA